MSRYICKSREKELKKKPNKKKFIIAIIIIIFISLCTIFVGTYLSYRFIGGSSSEDEIITKKEESNAVVEESKSFQNAVDLKIYYTQDYRKLSPEIVVYNFTKEDKIALATFIVERLFSIPNSPYLHPLFFNNFRLKGVYIIDNLLIVDIDNKSVKKSNIDVQMETLMVFSLVNTLMENIKGIESVQILINGEVTDTLMGHIDISKPLIPQLNLM